MARLEAGFSLAEALVSMTILTIASAGTVMLIAQSKRSAASSELTSSAAYYDDLLQARGSLLASNVLFWMNNVTDGCKNASYFIANQVPPGAAAANASALVAQDFSQPLSFRDNFTQALGHNLKVFTSFSDAARIPSLGAVKNWYDAFSDKSHPVAALISRCVTPGGSLLTAGTDATNWGEFRFCVVARSNYAPDVLEAQQTGVPMGEAQRPIVVGEFLVRQRDAYTGDGIACTNANASTSQQFNINRSMFINLTVGVVKNPHLSVSKQVLTSFSRSFTAPKSQRMLINCNHCINIADPAFQYECSAMVANGCVDGTL